MYPNIGNPLIEPESRDDVKELLENALENNYFPIVAVRANFSLVDNNGWFTKVESKNSDLTKNPGYLITTGGEAAQHAIILLKIEKWRSGNGISDYINVQVGFLLRLIKCGGQKQLLEIRCLDR